MNYQTILLLIFMLSGRFLAFSQVNNDTSGIDPYLSIFIGAGYDIFKNGLEYDQGGAGGTHYEKHNVDYSATKGYSSNIGLQFKIPFNKTAWVSLEGAFIATSHHFKYSFSEGAFGNSYISQYSYTTNATFARISALFEKRFGRKHNFYAALGPYRTMINAVFNSKGTEAIHSVASGTPAAPASIVKDTVIYDEKIKTNYRDKNGLTLAAGFIFPLKKLNKIFVEARYSIHTRNAVSVPNLKIEHFILNVGIHLQLKG